MLAGIMSIEKGNGRRRYIILLTILLGLTLAVSAFLFLRTEKEIRRFEETFKLTLPKETSVIFSEDTHGSFGEGASLYIYQLDTPGMGEFVSQPRLKEWLYLPITDKKMLKELKSIVKGISGTKISKEMNLDMQNGLVYVRNRYNSLPFNGYMRDEFYRNIIIGIVDIQKNKVYYYTSDM